MKSIVLFLNALINEFIHKIFAIIFKPTNICDLETLAKLTIFLSLYKYCLRRSTAPNSLSTDFDLLFSSFSDAFWFCVEIVGEIMCLEVMK